MLDLALAAMLALPLPVPPAAPPPPATAPPPQEQIMAVPAELRELVRERIGHGPLSRPQRLERLSSLLFGEGGLELVYDADANGTVEQSWRSRRVNCLSFSLLFVALAREAGLQAQLQEVDQALVWYQRADAIYAAHHVNAGVRVHGGYRTVDIIADSVMVRERPRAISDQRAFALLYNNLAVALIERGDAEAAGVHLLAALDADPRNVPALNNHGVLRLRNGDLDGAEAAYGLALEIDPDYASTLFNLVRLHRQRGGVRQAHVLQQRLERVRRRDPFHQFLAAVDHESRGDYRSAVAHYLRAIRLHRDEHRFFHGLARSYAMLGDQRRTRRALVRAHALGDEQSRAQYQAKLEHLSGGPR